MAKIKVEVEVEIEGKAGAKVEDFTFIGVKLADGQQCPLPKDAPCPRRFVSDLKTAAFNKLFPTKAEGKAEPTKTEGSK